MSIGDAEIKTQERVIRFFKDPEILGYQYIGNLSDYQNKNINEDRLRQYLRLKGYADKLIDAAVMQLQQEAGNLSRGVYDANKTVYSRLKYGIPVSESPEKPPVTVELIDEANPLNNDFAVAEEVTVVEQQEKRPDLVIYLNGIAVAVIELKRSSISVSEGIRQNLTNQKDSFIRGFFTTIVITETGKKVVAENPEKIDSKYLEQFPSFVDFASASDPTNGDDTVPVISKQTDLTPDDQLEDAYKQINASLASDLLSEVLKISPYTFEKLVVDLLSKMGYGTVAYGSHATVASGDDGIDGVIMEDKLGFSLIYMQAKEWAPDRVVGQPDIQSFVGAIAGKHGDGLFVTTAKFSQKAKDYANTHHIILIDGERLANLMIEYNFCVSTRKTFEIKAIDTDALAEYQDE